MVPGAPQALWFAGRTYMTKTLWYSWPCFHSQGLGISSAREKAHGSQLSKPGWSARCQMLFSLGTARTHNFPMTAGNTFPMLPTAVLMLVWVSWGPPGKPVTWACSTPVTDLSYWSSVAPGGQQVFTPDHILAQTISTDQPTWIKAWALQRLGHTECPWGSVPWRCPRAGVETDLGICRICPTQAWANTSSHNAHSTVRWGHGLWERRRNSWERYSQPYTWSYKIWNAMRPDREITGSRIKKYASKTRKGI